MLIGSFSKPYSVSSGEERKDNKKMLKGPFETHVEKRLMGICAPYRLLTRITASHPVWTHRPLGPVGVRVGDKCVNILYIFRAASKWPSAVGEPSLASNTQILKEVKNKSINK